MVVATLDYQIDSAFEASGGARLQTSPPAIHLVLEEGSFYQPFVIYRGSGGIISFSQSSLSGSNFVSIQPRNRVAESINEICCAFSLTKDQLASVFGVTRKTVYNWIDGVSKPKKLTPKKMYDLLLIAKAWTTSGYTLNSQALLEPVLEDQCLLDLLKQDTLNKEQILFAGSRLNLMQSNDINLVDPFA